MGFCQEKIDWDQLCALATGLQGIINDELVKLYQTSAKV
jgi:hypothetical protein